MAPLEHVDGRGSRSREASRQGGGACGGRRPVLFDDIAELAGKADDWNVDAAQTMKGTGCSKSPNSGSGLRCATPFRVGATEMGLQCLTSPGGRPAARRPLFSFVR